MEELSGLSSVTLTQPIPDALASQFGAKRDVPFDTTRRLYGWPERPGLYCDLLRSRGLYLSAACLQDSNADGHFDEGLRLDFHCRPPRRDAQRQDHRVNFTKVRVPLRSPIAYTPAAPTGEVAGKQALRGSAADRRAAVRCVTPLWLPRT